MSLILIRTFEVVNLLLLDGYILGSSGNFCLDACLLLLRKRDI